MVSVCTTRGGRKKRRDEKRRDETKRARKRAPEAFCSSNAARVTSSERLARGNIVCKASYDAKYTAPAGTSRIIVCVNPLKRPPTPRSATISRATATARPPPCPTCARHLTNSNGVKKAHIAAPAIAPDTADAPKRDANPSLPPAASNATPSRTR